MRRMFVALHVAVLTINLVVGFREPTLELTNFAATHVQTTAKSGQYEYVKVVTVPLSGRCSWWKQYESDAFKRFASDFGGVCGVVGYGGLEEHVDRIWHLIESARKEAQEPTDEVLPIFVASEWSLGRRYPNKGEHWVRPFNASDLEGVIDTLSQRMLNAGDDFKNWLVVPGSFYWGAQVNTTIFESKEWVVFNSLPIFFGGSLLWVHNKRNEADLRNQYELWGYSGYAKGRPLFEPQMVAKYGYRPFADFLMIDGWTVGVDICRDHAMPGDRAIQRVEGILPSTSRKGKTRFDIQLLVSAGMNIENTATSVRVGGLVVAADGTEAKPDMYLRPEKSKDFFGKMFKTKQEKEWIEPIKTLHSWEAGCDSTAVNSGYTLCKECESIHDAYSRKMLCISQPSNFAMMHIFGRRKLKAPYQESLRKFPGIATAVIGGRAVKPFDF